ncbi:MAG: TIGR02147 family protein [Fibrobacter sp.]|nr:TIGR02147 family protein [Fibrobacter sp.]
MKSSKIALKDYLDFRTYIKEYIEYKNAHGEQLTNRSFAAAIGINSSSWLTTILNGKKGITDKTIGAISDFFKHTEWEREYFKLLVYFNQAKTVESRNDFFTQLKQLLLKKGYLAIRVLDNDQYEYYSKWYYSAVRSIIGMIAVSDDFERLARYVSPSITAAQAKKSIKLLVKLGLIEKDLRGNYSLTNSAISTGYNVKSLAVANFQRETMKLGIEAIDRYDSSIRDISSLSIGISEAGFQKITGMIAEFRKAIAEVANSDNDADRVYQVNFQVFPLSRVLNHDENEKL